MYADVTFLFPAADLMEDIQGYYSLPTFCCNYTSKFKVFNLSDIPPLRL
jgi:hypothetical protein